MDDDDDQDEQPRNRSRSGEGVRIIGAEEAARALREGQAAGRRPEDAPRFGDVPKRPSGPPPAQRFPLPESVDPAEAVARPPVAGPRGQPEAPGPGMPHWTEPPSGEVPRILPGDDLGDDDDLDAWSSLPTRGPGWRDQDTDWDDADFEGVSALADDETRMGALDDSRSERSDLFSFDEPEVDQQGPAGQPPVTTSIRTRQPTPNDLAPPHPSSGERDMGKAVAVGVAMVAVALLLFKLGPTPTLVLAIAVVTLATGEVYDVFRRAGYRPATLLGVTATVSLMVAAYTEGETAVPLVLALTVIFSLLWYLAGVVRARPTVNVAVTLMGFLWTGFLGSFAALLLRLPDRRGIAFLLGAVIATIAYDVGGLFFGSQMGSRPLVPEISPNKTVEGLLGGMVLSLVLTWAIVGALPGIHPWTPGKALALGAMVMVVAPLGDLCESMVKRDLGIKDMGSLIPGHGGVLDRFDTLLFVLPATYYLVRLLDLA